MRYWLMKSESNDKHFNFILSLEEKPNESG